MPAFATSLSENDRWDLVNYLRSVYSTPDAAANR
jgi:mono/diheme cytochrome c family protein